MVNSIWLGELARETLSSSEYLVVRNGVDTKILNQVQNDKKDKFKKFTVTAGATVMGKKKGLKYLVEGFADLNQQFPESRLLLIGDGDSQSILESQVSELGIKDVVKFVGHKDKKWIARNLPKCHVLCLPSLAEGMSNAILEGMACGLPIVTTNPSKELIDGNGIIVKSMDSDQISKALSELYKNNKVRKSMSKKSRELAEKMSWDKVAKEYHKVYRDTVSS